MSNIATAWVGRAWQYRDLIRNLVIKDFKVRYQGSVLGFLWTLITPLAIILVYLFAFKFILGIKVDNYALFLITGILPWTFFNVAVITSTDAVLGNASLVKNIYFPRESLPVAGVLFHFIHFLLALVVFVPFLFILDAPLGAQLLAWPLVLAINLGLAVGLAFIVSALTVFYHDIKLITDLGLIALFWLTPIIYDISMVPARVQGILFLGPMTAIINGYQDILYWGRWPSADTWIVGGGWALGSLVLGFIIFRLLQWKFAEEL